MKSLIQQVTLFAPGHAKHLTIGNAIVEDGHLTDFGKNITEKKFDKLIKGKGHYLCVGFTDVRAHLGEPGNETKETLLSGMKAAIHGGFARVAVVPSSNPLPDTKAVIQQMQELNTAEFQFLPYGTISKNMEGKQLSEFNDLKSSGAIGFTDNTQETSTELMMRALEYSKQVNGKIFSFPNDPGVHPKAQMHEGLTSTKMGLKGSSHHHESIRIFRDLSLAAYSEAPIHFFSVSTAEGIDLIRKAKRSGQKVTCSIACHQLTFTDEDLIDFDSNKKVWPPHRSFKTNKALIKGILDGTVDAIESQHTPMEIEHKELEFEYADFGMNTLQHAFLIAFDRLKDELPIEIILGLFTEGPSRSLNIPNVRPEENCILFNPKGVTEISVENWFSNTKNTPFMNHGLSGSINLI
ncbi:MAG: dihydroorotase [Bacteroidota bacterium]